MSGYDRRVRHDTRLSSSQTASPHRDIARQCTRIRSARLQAAISPRSGQPTVRWRLGDGATAEGGEIDVWDALRAVAAPPSTGSKGM